MRDTTTDRLFSAPWWLPGGHAQTIWPAKCAQLSPLMSMSVHRERWDTPDGDFVDIDTFGAKGSSTAPVLVMFHGLEGSSRSHYARAFAQVCAQAEWLFMVPHFRGCSGHINHGPRAYHSGDHEEIDWILKKIKQLYPSSPLFAVGVSLGGNALLRWAGEQGTAAQDILRALAAVCAPVDLAAAGHRIDRGLQRWLYARMFLKTMVSKAQTKWEQYPHLFDLEAVRSARTLYEFDMHFTAPLHGFKDTDDYWSKASSKPLLAGIQLPSLVLNALNDPFIPAHSLPSASEVGQWVQLWQPATGGHVGFPHKESHLPWADVMCMPKSVMHWLNEHH